jgi:hypothetical protein
MLLFLGRIYYYYYYYYYAIISYVTTLICIIIINITPDQIFNPGAPDAGALPATGKSAVDPAGNDGATEAARRPLSHGPCQ